MLMSFLTLALVQLLALMSPGPDFFFISQTAVSRSHREAFMGVLGVTLGVAIWAAVALLGLNLLLQKMAWLHQLITAGGGLYLIWMGWQLLRSARRRHQAPVTEAVPAAVLASNGRTFFRGLLTNLSNPKVVIYFGSVFSLFVSDDVSSLQRGGIYALILLETLGWFMLVATVFALPWMRRKYQQAGKWLDGVGGVLFTAFGIHLILTR